MRIVNALVAAGFLCLMPVAGFRGSLAEPSLSAAHAWAVSSCILSCYDYGVSIGCIPDPGEHYAMVEGDTHEYQGGPHSSCFPGSCDLKHPACENETLAFEEVKDAIRSGASRSEYVRLADKHMGVVAIHGDAVSMYGCSGDLVAHIPFAAVGAS